MTAPRNAAIYDAPAEEIAASKAALLSALDARRAWEREHATDPKHLESICSTLSSYSKRASKLDPFTLAYASVNGIAWGERFLDSRAAGSAHNVYAMPKCWGIMRVCNGGSFDNCSDDKTTAAAVLAIAAKAYGKQGTNHINDTCTRWGMGRDGSYGAGGTQGGSSRRAMHTLGIINDTEGSDVKILRDDDFKRLLAAAKRLDKALSK